MPGVTLPQSPEMQKESGQFSQGLLSGLLEMPKNMLLDLPATVMDLSDYAQGKLFPPQRTTADVIADRPAAPVGQDEPVRHMLGVASKAYDDAVKSVLGISDETANSTTYDVGGGIGGMIAAPVGAEKAIMDAPSIIGKIWRAGSHMLFPSSLPGKALSGGAVAYGVHELTQPSDAEAATPAQQTAPPAVSDTGLPQITPVGEKLPKGWKAVGGTSPQADAPLPKGWKIVDGGGTSAPAPTNLPKGWTLVPDHVEAEHAQKQSDDGWWGLAALGTATGLGIALLSRGREAKSALELSRAGLSIFGKAETEASPEVSNLTKLTQGVVDGGASAREVMMKNDPQLGQDFADRQTLSSPTALTEKHEMALRDGVIAATNTKLNPLVDIGNKLEGLKATKDPNAPEKLAKYAYALDQLEGANRTVDQRLVRRHAGWENDVPELAGSTDDGAIRRGIKQYHQDYVDAIEQPRLANGDPNPNYSPEIMQLQMSLKQNYASLANHALKAGIIDKPTYFDWSTRDFMHLKAALDQGNLWERAWRSATLPTKELDVRDELGTLLERTNNDGERILPPIDAQEQYIRDLLRYTDKNDLWRRFYQSSRAAPSGSPFYKLVSDVKNTGAGNTKNLINFRDGGKVKSYQVNDDHVYSALKHNPSGTLLYPIINGSRVAMQAGTTGPLAPLWSVKGLGFDVFGIAALGDKIGPLGIVKMPYLAAKGIVQGMGARAARGMEQTLKASVNTDGTLPKLLGPQVTNTLIKRGGQIWRNSRLFQAQSVGAMGAARAMNDAQIGNRLTLMSKLAPKYATANPAVRSLKGLAHAYMSVWESVQNGARLGYFGHQLPKNAKYADLVKAGAEVRRATGDFAQKGSNSAVQAVGEIFPYANVGIQSLARIAHQFRTKPQQTLIQVGFSLAVPSIAGAVYANMMGQKYRDYWNRLPSNDRTSLIYLPVPGMKPERGIFIGVMPEWRPFHAMIADWMDGIFGLKHGIIDRNESKGWQNGLDALFNYRTFQDMMTGVQSGLLPFSPSSLPPVVNAGLNVGGVRNVGDITTGEPWKFAALKDDDLSALDPGGTTRGVWMPQKVEQILASLAGTAGLAFAHSVVAAEQAVLGNRSPVKAVAQQAALEMTRDLPLSTTMWGLSRKLGANTPADQFAIQQFQAMKRLATGSGTDIHNTGIGTRGLSLNILGNEDQFNQANAYNTISRFKDPNIANIVVRTGIYYRFWAKTWGNKMNSLGKTIEDVRSSTKLSPIEMRDKLNRLYMKMQDLHKTALSELQDQLIKPIRQDYGRAIDLDKIDVNSQITDFPPLTAP